MSRRKALASKIRKAQGDWRPNAFWPRRFMFAPNLYGMGLADVAMAGVRALDESGPIFEETPEFREALIDALKGAQS